MIVVSLLSLVFTTGLCQNITIPQQVTIDNNLVDCVIKILDEYFSESDELTYVNMNPEDDALLKILHSTFKFTLINRGPVKRVLIPNWGYLVYSANVTRFMRYFPYLAREATWNPYARFLIVIQFIRRENLKPIFDELLRRHVNNVVVLNGSDKHLYSYNPFDDYTCGNYYNTIINFAQCSERTEDLYPDKLVTGLRKCNFRAALTNRPPYTIDPEKAEHGKKLLGTEEFIIRLFGSIEDFTVSFNYSYNDEQFSTVGPNMTAVGPLAMLQKNECDIIFGGMMMVVSRAQAFTFLSGYHDYSDELRFAVKISSLIPTWTYVYLEFEYDVWILLLVTFILVSFLVVILLGSKDRGKVVMRLLDNLLLHGRHIKTRFVVKCVLLSWVWFTYLINTFYQSNLFSFTTQPIMRFQVSDEEDMIEYDFQPCFSHAIQKYLFSETNNLTEDMFFVNEGCRTTAEAMDTIAVTDDVFTLVPNYFYMYNKQKYIDKWGNSLVYYFEKPYTKLLFGYLFYKGFPISHNLQLNALRIKESGLPNKNLQDHYYAQKLKQKIIDKPYKPLFLLPWCIYIPGIVLATVAFGIELVSVFIHIK